MERNDSNSRPRSMTVVWAPLVAVAAIGAATTMIGRPKAGRRRTKTSKTVSVPNDPRVTKAVETAQRALDEAKQALASRDGRRLQEQLSRGAGVVRESTGETLSPVVKDAGDRARELAERVRTEGQARSADLSQRFRAEVAPKAKTYAQEAIDEAEGILTLARERATELSKSARKEYGPEVSNKAAAVAGLIAAGSSAGMQVLRDRAGEIKRETKSKRGRTLTDRGKKKASTTLRAAGGQAKYVASESIMLGFWAAMLGMTVYFAILTREQRDRIKGFLSNAVSQMKDVMSDFQSGDEEFQSLNR